LSTRRFLTMREVFHLALEVPSEGRDKFLITACGGDAALLEEIRTLLKANDEAGTFLQGSPTAPQSISEAVSPKHPGRVGPYRIIRELGRGGMGIVYLAVRDDGTFTKRVALKVIQGESRDEEALGRFCAERQVLAALDHPNITRILDAGDTQTGSPFYVMEYVEGEPLDAYCNRKELGLEPRLRLFQQVCSAVSYLHSQRVLHRVLSVSLHDNAQP
jgi:eukaryotic-like serine/threonine-protein kinase